MTRFETIKQYEEESGNTVGSDNLILDSMGHYVGKFSVDMARRYHDIVTDEIPNDQWKCVCNCSNDLEENECWNCGKTKEPYHEH